MSETQKTPFEFVEENLGRTPFHHWLKPVLKEVDEANSTVTIHLALRPEFCRAPGRPEIHGGVIAAFVDIVGHAGIAAKLGHGAATIDLRIDYLRLAAGTELRGKATVVKFGRTIGFVDVQIRDDADKPVANGRGTYLTKSI